MLGRFVPLDSLEEAYAGNRKRRRLLYAMRRHQTHSYSGILDHVANSVRCGHWHYHSDLCIWCPANCGCLLTLLVRCSTAAGSPLLAYASET